MSAKNVRDGAEPMFLCINLRRLAVTGMTVVSLCLFILVLSRKTAAAFLPSETEERVFLPVIMYHSILSEPSRQGDYVVSPEVLEADLKYLHDNGYETVLVKDLAAYIERDIPLPEKPVMITLDDGYYNNVTYLMPLLEKYDMQAIISVVGSYTERFSQADEHQPAYSHLTWQDISELAATGRIEIGNHSYDIHSANSRKGCKKLANESEEEYYNILYEDVNRLQTELYEKAGVRSVTFAYPYGYICDESEDVLRDCGIICTLNCYEKPNYITKDIGCLYDMNRYNRPSGISTEAFMKRALNG